MYDLGNAIHSTPKGVGKQKAAHTSFPSDFPAWATPIKKVTPIDLRTVISSGKQRAP
ncbi:hypothetical protein PTTG_30400, partial [Puccinia triticina 1-1 BBBD Race 1]